MSLRQCIFGKENAAQFPLHLRTQANELRKAGFYTSLFF